MVREIILQNSDKVTLVDDEDFVWLNIYKWYLSKNGYAVRDQYIGGKRYTLYMHKEITQRRMYINEEIDHEDRNKLNNQKENLRIATRTQNHANREKYKRNSSGYKGVSWHNRNSKWVANIRINRKSIYIGSFEDIEEAARAYDQKAKELFGEFACTNFPEI